MVGGWGVGGAGVRPITNLCLRKLDLNPCLDGLNTPLNTPLRSPCKCNVDSLLECDDSHSLCGLKMIHAFPGIVHIYKIGFIYCIYYIHRERHVVISYFHT